MIFFFFQGEDNAGADSELDESEESEPEEVEEKSVAPQCKSPSGHPLASGNKSNCQPAARSSEEV